MPLFNESKRAGTEGEGQKEEKAACATASAGGELNRLPLENVHVEPY